MGSYQFFDRKPVASDLHTEIIAGLSAHNKTISAKYFYDQRGSQLFEAITRLPEYYLTRTELELFDRYLGEMADVVGPGTCLVEYGSGSSLKIRKVLEHMQPKAYVPVDISLEHLQETALALHSDYSQLDVYPTCADITASFDLPEPVTELPKVGFFPGSSIGNFGPEEAVAFFRAARCTLGAGSRFIVGVDRKKPIDILLAAYNDAEGVTADFNLNSIAHLARMLGVPLDASRFRHRAIYNSQLGCVQMFLDVAESHEMRMGERVIHFEKGEAIHTENSFKYDPEEFLEVADRGGYRKTGMWTDQRNWFSIFLLEAAD